MFAFKFKFSYNKIQDEYYYSHIFRTIQKPIFFLILIKIREVK